MDEIQDVEKERKNVHDGECQGLYTAGCRATDHLNTIRSVHESVIAGWYGLASPHVRDW